MLIQKFVSLRKKNTMQTNENDISFDEVVTRSGLAARRIADDLSWGEGAIQPLPQPAGTAKQLVSAVLDAVEPVSSTETAYSSCTDGRLPVKLQSGEAVPVREQAVGADMVSAFFVAEVLGPRFTLTHLRQLRRAFTT